MSAPRPPAARRRPWGSVSARTTWVVLTAWAVLWGLLMARHGGVSWHYFSTGGLALLDLDDPAGSLHVYASHPDLQFGPVSMLVAALLRAAGGTGSLMLAQLLGAAQGLVVLALLDRVSASVRPLGSAADRRRTVLLAGLAFLPVWMNLAVRFVHIDDVLALTLTCAAVLAAVQRRPVLSGVLLGLAVAAKPWALPFLALALAVRPPARGRVTLAAVGAAATAWLPFVLADPSTLIAARFQIPTSPSSSLRVLGFGDLATPWWDRPLQMLLGVAAAVLLVRRGRWPAVVLVVVGIRIVLDPGAYSYYTAGIVVGAALWDLVGSRSRLPWWTCAAAASLFAARWLPITAAVTGLVRLVFVVTCLAVLVAPRRRPPPLGRRSVLRYPERHPGRAVGALYRARAEAAARPTLLATNPAQERRVPGPVGR